MCSEVCLCNSKIWHVSNMLQKLCWPNRDSNLRSVYLQTLENIWEKASPPINWANQADTLTGDINHYSDIREPWGGWGNTWVNFRFESEVHVSRPGQDRSVLQSRSPVQGSSPGLLSRPVQCVKVSNPVCAGLQLCWPNMDSNLRSVYLQTLENIWKKSKPSYQQGQPRYPDTLSGNISH